MFSKILLFVSVLAFLAFGAAPSDGTTTNATWKMSIIDPSPIVASKTTCTGATDSLTLISRATKFQPLQGQQLILIHKAYTQAGDSLKLRVVCDVLDADTLLLYRFDADTITAKAGEAILIPWGSSLIGKYLSIKLLSYTANGTVSGITTANHSLFYRKMVP